jgi:diguanylate cyclase (GGDEF)-like protein
MGLQFGWRRTDAGVAMPGPVALDTPPSTTSNAPVRWLIAAGVVLIITIAVGTAATVNNFRQRALDNANRELENTGLLLTGHFDQAFQDLNRIQKGLAAQLFANGTVTPAAFSLKMVTYDAHLLLKSKLDNDFMGDVTVLDVDGYVLNRSGAWPSPDLFLGDRDYFQKLKALPAGADDELVETNVSRFTGNRKIVFARRVNGPNGEFLGVVCRGIEPIHLEQYFSSVMLGDRWAVTMFMRDGTLLARFPRGQAVYGRKHSDGPLIQHLRFSDEPATLLTRNPVDGQEQLGHIRLLRDFPIALVVTANTETVLADWRSQTKFLVSVASLSTIIIAAILFLIIRHIRRQHQAVQAQLMLEKSRLGTAINNMTQGLVLFDAQTRVVIRNERYLEMYGLDPAAVRPGMLFRDLIMLRKLTGSFAGDVDDYVTTAVNRIGQTTSNITETADGRSIMVWGRPVTDGGWVATHEDVTERRNAEAKIAHLAHYDALTDLPNRTLFRSELERELKRVERGAQCAVLYIDIDEFKGINDSLGHPVGDALLKGIAERLRGCVRGSDVVARLGGDEFAIVQADVETHADVANLVARIFAAIRLPFECLGHSLLTDASIGIALAPRDGTDLDELLKNADLAMYGAKAEGRRTFRFFEPQMDAKVKARRTLELDLRRATDDGSFAESGFEVFYQPIVDLRDDTVTGCEALLRWRHPVRGMISPADFIPVAEEIGIISQLGEWVLATACHEAAHWPADTKVAVNVSPVQFRSTSLALKVAAALASSGLSAKRLELEITEAVLIRDDETALEILHGLRAIGVRIALDDFGTGYSSLSYLQRFPFDKIKIDRCFVTDIAEAHGSSSIVQAVVNIASSRNMTTTAEGVETIRQKELLRALGCTEMQGYLFSAAKPAEQVRALMAPPALESSAGAAA